MISDVVLNVSNEMFEVSSSLVHARLQMLVGVLTTVCSRPGLHFRSGFYLRSSFFLVKKCLDPKIVREARFLCDDLR